MIIKTQRLMLVPAGAEDHRAELQSASLLAERLGADIPGSWPPGEYDINAIGYFMNKLTENPDHTGWYSWYALLPGKEGQRGTAVGAAGYTGPANSEGTVEIGFSILPEFRNRGYASEIAAALVNRALDFGKVKHIIAHTAEDNTASARVLEKCGFVFNGPGPEPGYIQYVLPETLFHF